ncbi:MAG: tRNA (adenosine(37)-N6)-threonylcarbamoyltransferase complex transferase subunit TsaD [Chitinophagaceae bacterium]|nr:tRNA (adenosine(37)-N6)-threonylcarbamoyltransferase complex transferase subunit TsaD [Chitinophagaceae bacterium]
MALKILGIESSCDDTCAAVTEDERILSNVVARQLIHEKYGGVIPEVASRKHLLNISMVVEAALQEAGVKKEELNAVAFTKGPGLMGSLMVGCSFAKAFSWTLDIPLIPVNHLQGHILANFIDAPKPSFPFLCLTISGGHTQLVVVHDFFQMDIIGETKDDAVGEAFDKTAKIMGIPYPGGVVIDQLSQNGNPHSFPFPSTKVAGLDFSFSGIKTAVLYFLKENMSKNPSFIEENKHDICASIQYTLVQMLLKKLILASEKTNIKNIAVAGGVASNSFLRKQLQKIAEERNWNIFIPHTQYCTDNAAMIAITGYYLYKKNKFSPLTESADVRIPFLEIVS